MCVLSPFFKISSCLLMYYITFFRTNQCVFTHKKVAIHLGPATFKIFTSHQQPGRHRTSDNRIRPPPENRMIRCLGAEFHLTQTLVDAVSCLSDCLGKQLIRHKMGAGAGRKKSAIFHKLHGTKVNLTIALMAFLTEFLDLVNAGGLRLPHHTFRLLPLIPAAVQKHPCTGILPCRKDRSMLHFLLPDVRQVPKHPLR